jgi:hypothetical protein
MPIGAGGLQPSWTDAALHAAKLIEDGLLQIPLPEPKVINEVVGEGEELGDYDACWHPLFPEALMWSHGVASRHYPSVNWLLPEGRFGEAAVRYGQQVFDMQARSQARLLDATPPEKPVAGTFHEVLDKYDSYIDGEKLSISSATERERTVMAR